jgi:hypothetical protein
MSSDARKPTTGPPGETAPLSRALNQSQHVQDKVEQAGVGLASVNAALKVEVAERVPFAKWRVR